MRPPAGKAQVRLAAVEFHPQGLMRRLRQAACAIQPPHVSVSTPLLQAHQARDGAVAAERRLLAQVMQQKQEVGMLKLKVEQAQAAARAARDEAHQAYGRRLQVAPSSYFRLVGEQHHKLCL